MKTIYYTDYNGNLLTEQQLQLADSYIKVFKVDNRLRKEEFYNDGILSSSIYYVEFGSPHNDLLNLNLESISINEIEDVNSNYTKYHSYGYKNGIIQNKGLSVRTNFNDVAIMYQGLDLQTNLPDYNSAFKLYEDKNNGYEFEFNYYPTGELASVIVSNDTISFYEEYRSSELDLIPNFEWWNQYSSYYLNAEPAVPNGIIIV
jgi:hypothetical protein